MKAGECSREAQFSIGCLVFILVVHTLLAMSKAGLGLGQLRRDEMKRRIGWRVFSRSTSQHREFGVHAC